MPGPWFCAVLLFFGLSSPATPQTQSTTPVSDPSAVAFATQAYAALTGKTNISDVTLTATATRTAGSDVEAGTMTLKALGTGESRFDLNSNSGTRSEVRNLSNGAGGFWIGLDGVTHPVASHNCLTDASWFFPPLSILSQLSSPGLVITYVGEETRAGTTVQHLHFVFQSAVPSTSPTAPLLRQLGAEDYYLDAASLLPVALTFNTHPDNNALASIPIEVDFSNYQAVDGIKIPFRIQEFLNGTSFLDISIQSATLNSGLASSDFTAE